MGEFTVAAIVDDHNAIEIVFSREGQQRFRTDSVSLSIALEFVEKHTEIQFVDNPQ